MKVKIKNKVYDGKKEPVMIIVSGAERKQIASMDPRCSRYCQFPEDKCTIDEIKKWMMEPPKEEWELELEKKIKV